MKKYIIILASVFVVAVMGIAGVAAANSAASQEYFATSGYVIDAETSEKIAFTEQTVFSASSTGSVQFQSASGTSTTLSDDTFVHLDDSSVMALSDGVLLDFADLSSNFINNYYTTRTLSIVESGTSFVAETESGTITFGEHLWKLSDEKYMVRSSSITVHFSDSDVRDAGNYVEVSITADGIVQILSETDTWMTISESCYIETAGGVIINPVTKIIDDGTYQITINKLVVSADDSIVLTEDETRRQIVPEINIEAIDGEDGADGTGGTSGADGTGGDDGDTGSDGDGGSDGDTGTSGSNGANGTKGVDSTVSSSTNTALPSMSIIDWNVTGTSLQATVEIAESGSESLSSMYGLLNAANEPYYGSITITNASTGEVVNGYYIGSEYDYDLEPVGTEGYLIDFSNPVNFSFTTMDPETLEDGIDDINVLEPDTQYILSISAYYMINDTIYNREFISRTFYTDSSGLQLSLTANSLNGTADPSTTTATATVAVSASQDTKVTLYLLTAAQNSNATLTTISNNYTQTLSTYTVTADSVNTEWVMSDLAVDSNYVVRAVVEVNGKTSLSSQELTFTTLKRQPDYGTGSLTAYYNRVTGLVEVYVPNITDYDSGMVEYVFTAYDNGAKTGTAEVVDTKTVTASSSTSTTFYLTNSDYYFTAVAYFYDNEKTTITNLTASNVVTVSGSTLPKIAWKNDDSSRTEYDKIDNTIVITLNGDTSYMQIDGGSDYGVKIDVYADQVMDTSVTLYADGGAVTTSNGLFTFTIAPEYATNNSNVVEITVTSEGLSANKNYTFTISGTVNLGDGDGAIDRTIGSLTNSTYEMNTGVVNWGTDTESSTSIAYKMSIDIMDGGSADSYTAGKMIDGGAVTVKISSGSGTSASTLASITYTDTDDLGKIFGVAEDGTLGGGGEGVEINENTFNLPTLSSDSVYTLEVTYAADATYNDALDSYQNEMSLSNKTQVVTAKETPPDLTLQPETAVTATPITNAQASVYGVKYNEDMSDETIVGYLLESSYYDDQQLATSVTYYMFEYAEFYTALQLGVDPIIGTGNDAAEILRAITIPVTVASTTLPSVAVFFDDATFNFTYDNDAENVDYAHYYNGSYVLRGASSNDDYFARGYRYLFAYTATYNVDGGNSDDLIYPYDHSSYDAYTDYCGSGIPSISKVGVGVAYILNSGLVSVPKTTPVISSYVYSTDLTNKTVTVHYTFYDDPDATINILNASGSITQISYLTENGVETTQDINLTGLDGVDLNGYKWYSITLPNTASKTGDALLTPEILISDYVDDSNYTAIFADLTTVTAEDETLYLAQIPVETDYTVTSLEDVSFDIEVKNGENIITFMLYNEGGLSDASFTTLIERAYSLAVTFKQDGKTLGPFYLSLDESSFGDITATFSTSQISDFAGSDFEVSAVIYYDNGAQGWSLVEEATENNTTGMFGLQRTNNTSGDFELSSYYTYVSQSGRTSSSLGGLLTTTTTNIVSELQTTGTADLEATDALKHTTFKYASSGVSLYRYLTAEHYGVSDTTESSTSKISSNYIVPKGVSAYTLISFTNKEATTVTDKVDYVTPTVGSITTGVGATSIQFESFAISGATGIDKNDADGNGNRYVTITVYEDYDGAVNYDKEVASRSFIVSDTGTPNLTSTKDENGDTVSRVFGNLSSDTIYHYVFTVEVEGVTVTLLDTVTAALAEYSFETIDGLKLTTSSTGIVYSNTSYTDKRLSYTYTLNNYSQVSVRYDIYSQAQYDSFDVDQESNEKVATIEGVAQEPLLSYEALTDTGMLTAGSLYTTNTINISLTPSEDRAALEPGQTYYLRIYVYADAGEDKVVSDTLFEPFKITAVTTPSALVYTQEATKDTLTFWVSVVDMQYSLMDTDGGITPYVVRFTDEDGNRIYTTYDTLVGANYGDIVFDAGVAKQEFSLYYTSRGDSIDPDTTLAGISLDQEKAYWENYDEATGESIDSVGKELTPVLSADTTYYMYVYSLIDTEHDGLSYPTSVKDDGTLDTSSVQTASDFAGANDTWDVFNTLVDTFWSLASGVAVNVEALDIVEDCYAIVSKKQSTTNDDNFLLNKDGASVSYVASSGNFQLILSESYGIVTITSAGITGTQGTETHVFEKIEYTVEGYSYASNAAVKYYGISLLSDGDSMFEATTDVFNFDTFTYVIPEIVSEGSYTITIKLYEDESDTAAYETLSFKYTS